MAFPTFSGIALPNALTRRTRLLFKGFVASAFCSIIAPPSYAQDRDDMIRQGQVLFERHWTYEPPKMTQAEIAAKATPQEQVELLMSSPGDGLGPMYNADSCSSCHKSGGAAGVDRNVTLLTIDPRSELNVPRERRHEVRQTLLELYPGLLSPVGVLSMDVVVHEKSSRPFYDEIRDGITDHIPGGVPDDWYSSSERTSEAIARQPVLAGRLGGITFYLSQRNSPPLFGLDLIDKIEVPRLSVLARSQARRSNGKITGRVGAGKFGWRGQTASLEAFVRGACAGELGLQLRSTPQPSDVADDTYLNPGLDLQEEEVFQLVSYVRSLPKPRYVRRRTVRTPEVVEGKKLFGTIGCQDCHVEHISPALGIYSDLLLHDMGDLLQAPSPAPLSPVVRVSSMRLPRFTPEVPPSSRRIGSFRFPSINGYYGGGPSMPRPYAMALPSEPRFPPGKVPASVISATKAEDITWDQLQREWRTPPLWGVADSGPYLHDGRATTLDAAILWHGGEANESAAKYRALSREQRKHVVTFLKSLRAPEEVSPWDLDRPDEDERPNQAPSKTQLNRLAESDTVFDTPWD